MTLDLALQDLEANGGLANVNDTGITASVEAAAVHVAGLWENERAVPPPGIWRRTLEDVRILADRALNYRGEQLADARS